MKYRDGYRYQLHEDEVFRTRITTVDPIETHFISLQPGGTLTVRRGYAWDGASWAFDTPSFMRGSLAHDALYQLMRMGLLDNRWRAYADEELLTICKEDGMWAPRRWWILKGVKWFAAKSAEKGTVKEILEAP